MPVALQKPMANRLEATLDTIKAMGTRMRKVEERLLAMEKTVRPQPLKKSR